MSVKNCGVALAEVAGRVGVFTSAVFKMIKRTGKKFDQAQSTQRKRWEEIVLPGKLRALRSIGG